jgi:hypothetical protein
MTHFHCIGRQELLARIYPNDSLSNIKKQVIHDKLSVSDASVALDELMKKRPYYGRPAMVIIGGMCSASICTVSFGGSFIDALLSFPLGALLVLIQILSVRNILYTYVFECVAFHLLCGRVLIDRSSLTELLSPPLSVSLQRLWPRPANCATQPLRPVQLF